MTSQNLIDEFSEMFAAQTAKPSEHAENRTESDHSTRDSDRAMSGHPTREASEQVHTLHTPTREESNDEMATNARTHARVNSSAATPHPSGLVAPPEEVEQSEQPNRPDTPTRARGFEARTPDGSMANARVSGASERAPESTTNAQARVRVKPFPRDAREARSVAESTGHRGHRLREARAWLQSALANGPRPAAEIYAEGDALLHSRRNLERACTELGVESFQRDRKWWKQLGSDRQLVQTVHPYARARVVRGRRHRDRRRCHGGAAGVGKRYGGCG